MIERLGTVWWNLRFDLGMWVGGFSSARRRYGDPSGGEKVYVVFSYGDPMPITTCRYDDLAEEYAAALARLPIGHPLRTEDAIVDEVPLLSELPEPLRDPENQAVPL